VIRSKLVAEGADRLQDCDLDLGQVDGPRLEMLSPPYTTCKETTLHVTAADFCRILLFGLRRRSPFGSERRTTVDC
jgi:hypothetical protein